MAFATTTIAAEDRLAWAFRFAVPYGLILVALKVREMLWFGMFQPDGWLLIKTSFWIVGEFVVVVAVFRGLGALRAGARAPLAAVTFASLCGFAAASHEILHRLSVPINLFVISKAYGFFVYLGGYFAETKWAVLLLAAVVTISILPTVAGWVLHRFLFRPIDAARVTRWATVVAVGLLPIVALAPARPAAITYVPSSALAIAYEMGSRSTMPSAPADPSDGAFLAALREPVDLEPDLAALAGRARGMNVVFYLLETNADYFLNVDGPFTALTPNFRRLAARGLQLRDHHNVSMLSIASLYNLLSSSYTSGNRYASGHKYQFLFLDDHPLARLKAAGYSTGMFTSAQLRFDFLGYTLKDILGFDMIFDADEVIAPEYRRQGVWFDSAAVFDDRVVIDEAARWIEQQSRGEDPLFAILWPQDSHAPYWSPPDRRRRLADSDDLDRFLNSLAYQDHLLGVLVDSLERLGVLDDTLIVVTADHGIKHGFGEIPEIVEAGAVNLLRETDTHMPALFYQPALFPEPIVYDGLTSHLDLLPTLLDLLGVGFDADAFDGRSIFSGERNRVVTIGWGFDGRFVGFVTSDHKFKYDRLSTASEVLRRSSPASRLLDGADAAPLVDDFSQLAESWRRWELGQMRLR